MPAGNQFRHQRYTDAPPPPERYSLVRAGQEPLDQEVLADRMRRVGDRFREVGVDAVYLVHGTFVGDDAAGLLRVVSRFMPAAGAQLRRLTKQAVNRVVGERGNFTPSYARRFEAAINRPHAKHIPVRLFHWSGENHHVGRAEAALALLEELERQQRGGRILLWGHSHAGNVFALLSNLLSGDAACLRDFFTALEPLYGRADDRSGSWHRLRQRLTAGEVPVDGRHVDVVTLGTPIRYGWDTAALGGLLHVVHHRPHPSRPEHLAAFPRGVKELLRASGGDYIQQFGIAGTNFTPSLALWRTWRAERRLNALLQGDIKFRHLPQHAALGMRVPEDGQTLLVDYQPVEGGLLAHHAGHALYTHSRWLLFHAEAVCRWLYADTALGAASFSSSIGLQPACERRGAE